MILINEKIKKTLLWSEKYTGTDMTYLANGVFWVGIQKVSIFIFSFILMLAFAHLTSKETFGAYQYILSILGIASIFSLPGANISLMKSVAQDKDGTFRVVLKERFKWSLIGSLLIFCVACWYFYVPNTVLGITLLLTGLGLPFFLTYDSFEYFLNGKKDFKKSMYYTSIANIIPSCILILTLLYSENIILIMIIFILTNSLTKYFFTEKIKSELKNEVIDNEAIKLGRSLTFVQGIDIINSYIDKILVWSFFGPVSVAIYSFAQIPISKMQQLAPIQILSLPKLSAQNIQKDRSIIMRNFLKIFLLMIPITIVFITFIPWLYKIFFTQYLETIPYVRVLGSMLILMPITYLTTAMIAESRGREITIIQIITFILRLVLFFALVSSTGIWSIVYATIIAEIIKSILTIYIFSRTNKFII